MENAGSSKVGSRPARREAFVVQRDWQKTSEARGLINALLGRNKRKSFGLLEKPQFEQGGKMYPVLFRRLFLVGKSGVGKTSTVHKLMGRDIPCVHEETLGIQTTALYWPVMLEADQRTVIVKLELWDVGERMLSRFDHILPTCKQSTDGILFFFSYSDRHSWETLPQLFTSILGALPTPDTFNMVIGTHADCSNREVSERELERFQRQHKIIALPTSNVNTKRHAADPSVPDGRAAIEV
ncbi:ciliogenesis and planar polarity effector 2-like isoform X2 [Halichondria panicea]|uniref:ciliogenesis and planar polarity effector 2-like isoform X2 n=1 Tax=Halichondria panicea TaxID=6063 RepID=UPI00312B5DB1